MGLHHPVRGQMPGIACAASVSAGSVCKSPMEEVVRTLPHHVTLPCHRPITVRSLLQDASGVSGTYG